MEGNNVIESGSQTEPILKRAFSGSFWTILGYGSQQFLRLASNLILSRLLFPEAFGIMTLVNVVILGLQMMADFGIGPSIVQSKRGDDPVFLNSAWTFQIARGLLLWIIICLVAWPASRIYKEPLLLFLIPASGLNSFIVGFRSTNWLTAERHILIGRRTILEILIKILSTGITIFIAYFFPTVWALILGAIAGSILTTLVSHLSMPGMKNAFFWDKDCIHELFHFGIWILIATFATYISGQGLRLVQGALVDSAVLGVISIAGIIAWSLGSLLGQMTSKVLFPLYARYKDSHSNEVLAFIKKTRFYFALFAFPFYIVLIFWGQEIIDFLYDARYHEAGRYVTLITISTAIGAIAQPYGSALIAFGDTKKHMACQIVSSILRVCGVFIGYKLGRVSGMLIGNWFCELIMYPIQIYFVKPHGLWQPKFDLTYFMLILLLVTMRFYIL